MKSLPQWSATVLLTAPVGAWALGLGDIELQSALNQPLLAEIELTSVTQEELDGLRVDLASRERFAQYGLDRPAELSDLRFDLTRNAAGRYVVRVSSRRPIADPFLTLLVEVTWPRGRMLREYTVLLDPPIFTPGVGFDTPPVRQAEAGGSSATSGAFDRTPETVAAPRTSAASGGSSSPAPAPGPAPVERQPALAGDRYVVQQNDTLWNIASRVRPEGVSINQAMVGLFESNPAAFDGNMNRLLRGATLTIPERAALTARSQGDATAFVSRQEASWRERASGGAVAETEAPASSGETPRLVLLPPSTDSVTGESSASAASGRAGGAGAAGGAGGERVARLESEVAALQRELDESRMQIQLRDQQLEALQARLAGADDPAGARADSTPAGAIAPGVDLEQPLGEPLFADDLDSEAAVAELDPAAEVTRPAEAVAAPAAASTSPDAAARPPAVQSPPAEPSLLSRIIGALASPALLIGLGIGAVLLAIVVFLRHRREDAADVTGRWEALSEDDTVVDEDTAAVEPTSRLRALDPSVVVEEQPKTRQGAAAAATARPRKDAEVVEDTLSNQAVINLDQGDVLAEADFHMAYGLYDQAAELVQKALEDEPQRRDLKLKLLEVFFVWGNKDAFRDAARALRDEIGDASGGDWGKVLIMGKQLCPDDAMFAEAAGGAAGVDVDLEATGGATALDFPFDEGDGTTEPDFEVAARDATSGLPSVDFDFDLAATGEQIGGTFDIGEDDETGTVDISVAEDENDDMLDIGAHTAAGLEAALLLDSDEEEDTETGVAALTDDEDTGKRDALGASDTSDASTAIELEGLADTYESPTVESAAQGDGDWTSALGLDGTSTDSFDIDALVEDVEESSSSQAPTVEAAGPDAPTVETLGPNAPTVETFGPDSPTIESPRVAAGEGMIDADSPTMESPWANPSAESPTLKTEATQALRTVSGETSEMPAIDGGESAAISEYTEEIDLDDLGLSIEDLSGLPDDLGSLPEAAPASDTREQPALETSDEDLLSATGVTAIVDGAEAVLDDAELDVLGTAVLEDDDGTMLADDASRMLADDDGTMLADDASRILADDDGTMLADDVYAGTEVFQRDGGGTSMLRALDSTGTDGGVDLDVDDLTSAFAGGDTMEQPRLSSSDMELAMGGSSVDLDVGFDSDDEQEVTETTSLDPHTMTEIGTKLDLARAYIDMGDPEGARSILEEVLDEGDAGQRREAQGLIDAIAS